MSSSHKNAERPSPLGHEHSNLIGRYHFRMAEAVSRGELRTLRNPNDPEA